MTEAGLLRYVVMTEISTGFTLGDLSLEGLRHAELDHRIAEILVGRRVQTILDWLDDPENERKVLWEDRLHVEQALDLPAQAANLLVESGEIPDADRESIQEVSSVLSDQLQAGVELPEVRSSLSNEEKRSFAESHAGKIIALFSAPYEDAQLFPEEIVTLLARTPLKGLLDVMSEEIGGELREIEERRLRLIEGVREAVKDGDVEALADPNVERAVFKAIFATDDDYIASMNIDGRIDHAKKRALERFQEECKNPFVQAMLGVIIPQSDMIGSATASAAIFRELLILDAQWIFA